MCPVIGARGVPRSLDDDGVISLDSIFQPLNVGTPTTILTETQTNTFLSMRTVIATPPGATSANAISPDTSSPVDSDQDATTATDSPLTTDSVFTASPTSPSTPLSTENGSSTEPDSSTTPTDTAESTATQDPTTTKIATSVIPVTSTISVSGTDQATTIWMTPLPTSAAAADQSAEKKGSVNTGEVIVACIVVICLLTVAVLGCLYWRKQRRAREDADADVMSPGFTGESPFSPVSDPFQSRYFGDSVIIRGVVEDNSSLHGSSTQCNTEGSTEKPPELPKTNPRPSTTAEVETPPSPTSDSSSTLSYINSLCPETVSLAPSLPQGPTTSVRAESPMGRASPRPVVGSRFRPLPMPVPLSPLAAAHFPVPEERGSVWSMMDMSEARDSAYSEVYWGGFSSGSLDDVRPPEYSRY